MNTHKVTGVAVVLILISMTICPAVAFTRAIPAKAESHCHQESPSAPQDNEKLLCCCNQDALVVPVLHVRFDAIVLKLLLPAKNLIVSNFQFETVCIPPLSSSKHLAELSTLRL